MNEPAQTRILVVEDMPALREHIVETLGELGSDIAIHSAGDGREALALIDASAQPYQLIVCDIIMPHLDGEALLGELRRRSYASSVIMLTALGQDDVIVRCLRLGACDYLIKPVGIDELIVACGNALQHLPLLNREIDVEYDPHGWFEISGQSDASVLYKYRKFLCLLDKFKIPEPAASEVRLALEELGRNAIEWGNKGDQLKKVKFGARVLPGKIIVSIEDEGDGFKHDTVPNPSLDPLAHIESRKDSGKRMGGYGIHLIKHLMDKLIYNAKGNRVVAIKYLDRERHESLSVQEA
ncbi:MAG: response regulator [Planctomycetes bacterium]|nr:response regulator [Planctomycetota bacterium]